jgi:hypothetical protein|tara:strand:- start:224 stop:535 length:312 start_codon:yes stop_codon:yes gene_type:complete
MKHNREREREKKEEKKEEKKTETKKSKNRKKKSRARKSKTDEHVLRHFFLYCYSFQSLGGKKGGFRDLYNAQHIHTPHFSPKQSQGGQEDRKRRSVERDFEKF